MIQAIRRRFKVIHMTDPLGVKSQKQETEELVDELSDPRPCGQNS